MPTTKATLLTLLTLLGLSILSAQAFTVDPTEQNRSSLVRLRGPGFGNTQGRVAIGALAAPIAHWDDNLIECYVPEAAALGTTRVVVSTRRPAQKLKARMTVLPRET